MDEFGLVKNGARKVIHTTVTAWRIYLMVMKAIFLLLIVAVTIPFVLWMVKEIGIGLPIVIFLPGLLIIVGIKVIKKISVKK